jgi:Fe-S cluster assembly ATPase SufC
MVQGLRIKNFRCFEQLDLNDLRRFNLVVGQNGSGKTALLECLYLLSGVSPELYFGTRYWRGLGERVQLSTDRGQYESVFRALFFELDTRRVVEAELLDPNHGRRSLRIFYEGNHVLSLPLGPQAVSSLGIKPITFRWQGFSGKVFTSRVEIVENQLRMPTFDEPYPGVFLTPGALLNPEDTANRFSELSKRKMAGPVIEALQHLFPQVEDLSLEVESGTNMLFASVNYLDRKVPVGVLSAGISKLLSLLIAIAEKRDGMVLLDEMENGLYFEAMPQVWAAVVGLCRSNNVQLFVTTHSSECLRALLPEVKRAPDEFCLLRAGRYRNKNIIEFVEGTALEAALEQRVEVR